MRIGTKTRKNEGLPIPSSQSLSSGHFHPSVSYTLHLVLLQLNSLSPPLLPNQILHLCFLTRIVISPSYHVFKILTLKSVIYNSFLSHIPYHSPVQIFTRCFDMCQIGPLSLSLLPSALLQACLVSCLDCFGNLLPFCSPAALLPVDFFLTFKF